MDQTTRIGIVVVEPLHVVRAGLALLLSAQADMEVLADAAEVDDARRALSSLPRHRRVVALVDAAVGGAQGVTRLVANLCEAFPHSSVVVMGADADAHIVSRALLAGAGGFVDKRAAAGEFVDALRRAAAGELVLSGTRPWVADVWELIEHGRGPGAPLTERELEVLQLAATGLTAREMGSRLGLRERTVTTHLTRIYGKLGVGTRMAAVAAAARAGLVSIDGRP